MPVPTIPYNVSIVDAVHEHQAALVEEAVARYREYILAYVKHESAIIYNMRVVMHFDAELDYQKEALRQVVKDLQDTHNLKVQMERIPVTGCYELMRLTITIS